MTDSERDDPEAPTSAPEPSPNAELGPAADASTQAATSPPDDTSPNDTSPNDTSPNGTSPNDTSPNDTSPNDTSPNDTSATHAKPDRRGLLHALGAAALAFMLIMAVTSDPSCTGAGDRAGQAAIDFALPVVGGLGADEGDRIDLGALRGHTVVLDFWASWCPPCRASVPALEAFSEAHPEVSVVGVNVESERDAAFVREAHESLGGHYPTVLDHDGALQQAYRIVGLPTLLVVGPDGVVRASHLGAVDERWLERHAL